MQILPALPHPLTYIAAWVLSILFALASLAVISANWLEFIRCRLLKHEYSAADRPRTGCVGGLFGAAALLLVPVPGIGKWFWVALLIDISCLPLLLYSIYFWAFVRRQNPFERNPTGAAVCPGCGGLSDRWAAYCADCGASLKEAAFLPEVRPDRPRTNPRREDNVVCPTCHLVTTKQSRYCYGGGHSLENALDVIQDGKERAGQQRQPRE